METIAQTGRRSQSGFRRLHVDRLHRAGGRSSVEAEAGAGSKLGSRSRWPAHRLNAAEAHAAEAADAHDEALLDMIAMEMGAPDPFE